MKLATLIILLGTISVSLLFASTAVIIYVDFPSQQDKLLEQGGLALADNLRRQIEPAVVTGDRLHLEEAITNAKLSDKYIEYIVVLDSTGAPLASTFPRGVPLALIDLVVNRQKSKNSMQFSAGDQPLVNMSIPIMGGDLGSLHIGFDRRHIVKFVKSRILKLSIVFTIMAFGALTAAYGIGKGVGKPLDQVARALGMCSGRWPQLDHIDSGPTYEVKEFLAILKRMIKELETAEMRRRDYEKKLLGMERMASVGQLAAEVAHEINNPLDGLMETVRYLENVADDPVKVRKYLPLMKKGLTQIEKTGRHLLTLTRGGTENYSEMFDVCEVIRDTTMLLSSSVEKHGATVEVAGERECLVVGNAIATGQAVMNLLLNATDAIANKGNKIIIDVSSVDGEVLVVITDDGSGVDDEIKDQIFEPFFSTKKVGQSTGLGLAVSRTLMQKGGGDLVLMEGRGENSGAKFAIKLIKFKETSGNYGAKR
jgi:signal transduction histidine kinase